MGNLVFQATLGGQVNLVGPNTASTYNINVPSVNGNLVTTGDTGTVTNTMLATSAYTAPGTIGSGTANTGAFTTLSASSTVSGTGFSTYLASPPAIGGTAAAAGSFTTLTGSTSVTTPIVKSASSLTLQSNGTTTAVTIDTSQNVGIGTTSPAQKLDVAGTLAVRNASTSYINTYCSGSGNRDYQLGVNGSAFVFNDITSGTTERMRIDSNGNTGFGRAANGYGKLEILFDPTTSSNNFCGLSIDPTSATSGAKFIQFYNEGGSGIGSVSRNAATNAVLYNTTSDYRLKENPTPLTGALARVVALKPVQWVWKDCDGAIGEGFIAHEVQEVVAGAVNGEKDAVDENGNPQYQGMDASYLVATLTAAIQELKAINDTQAETINALTARVMALEAK